MGLAGGLRGDVLLQTLQFGELVRNDFDGGVIRREVAFIACQQESALPGLGIGHRRAEAGGRFHYGSHGRRGNYSEAELREWAARFRDWSTEVEILAYFNNDWEVFAVRNALRMKTLLQLR